MHCLSRSFLKLPVAALPSANLPVWFEEPWFAWQFCIKGNNPFHRVLRNTQVLVVFSSSHFGFAVVPRALFCFFFPSLSTTKPPPGTAALCSSAGIADAVWPGRKPRSSSQNLNLNWPFSGGFLSVLGKHEWWTGQQASLGVSNPLAGAVCVCFVRLDFLSEKKNDIIWSLFCIYQLFLVLKPWIEEVSLVPVFVKLHIFTCRVLDSKSDPVWALWAPQNLSCCGLDQTSHVPTWDAVNFISRFHQS